jgi:hypothetical protein
MNKLAFELFFNFGPTLGKASFYQHFLRVQREYFVLGSQRKNCILSFKKSQIQYPITIVEILAFKSRQLLLKVLAYSPNTENTLYFFTNVNFFFLEIFICNIS